MDNALQVDADEPVPIVERVSRKLPPSRDARVVDDDVRSGCDRVDRAGERRHLRAIGDVDAAEDKLAVTELGRERVERARSRSRPRSVAPCFANNRAVARPIPLPAPVMTTTRLKVHAASVNADRRERRTTRERDARCDCRSGESRGECTAGSRAGTRA